MAKTKGRKGCDVVRDVPANSAFPSSCTGSVSLQKKPRTPSSAKEEDSLTTTTTLPDAHRTLAVRWIVWAQTAAPSLQAREPVLRAGGSQDARPFLSAWPFKSRSTYCQHRLPLLTQATNANTKPVTAHPGDSVRSK